MCVCVNVCGWKGLRRGGSVSSNWGYHHRYALKGGERETCVARFQRRGWRGGVELFMVCHTQMFPRGPLPITTYGSSDS